MALNRRDFLLGLPVGCALLQGCAQSAVSPTTHYYAEIARSSNAAAKETILVCMPETPQTMEVWAGLRDELAKNYSLVALRVEDRAARSVIEEGIRRHRPASIVLMNNPTVAAYNDYQRNASNKSFPPVVVVMTSFLDAGRQT